MTNRGQDFLEQMFHYQYCDECGGDAEHHQVSYAIFEKPFAFCTFPPSEETGERHPTILAFRKVEEEKTA